MAKYCVKCGRKLADGAVCSCRIKGENVPWTKMKDTHGKVGLSFRKLLGINDINYDKGQDYYERGKWIVPDLIAACEDEVPVKQYHIADLRSRVQGLWAEGRLMVTNKRILFRASGRSFFGRTQVESEYSMEEISGVNISRGIRFGLFDFFVAFLLSYFVIGGVILGLTQVKWILPLILLIAGIVGLFLIPRKKYRYKILFNGLALGSVVHLFSYFSLSKNGFFTSVFGILGLFFGVMAIIFLVMASTKSVISLSIMCKTGTAAAISMCSRQSFGLQWAPELLPAEDAEAAMVEIGAIINDIQQRGDYGIDKWQVFREEKISEETIS
ncbi:MAG: sulfite exporter TauE/SafE family protein [Acutalibacter sp.]